eukprot:1157298-Pelagomonas_calceolata.AAC.25
MEADCFNLLDQAETSAPSSDHAQGSTWAGCPEDVRPEDPEGIPVSLPRCTRATAYEKKV